jgi:hypothetical protein
MTAAPAAAPMICCLREELTGVSARLDITSLAILDSDGRELDDGEALERQDDPDLIFCAVHSTLLEVSQGRSALLLKLGARSSTASESWRGFCGQIVPMPAAISISAFSRTKGRFTSERQNRYRSGMTTMMITVAS